IVTSADVTMEKEDELMIVENVDEDSAQPWKKPHNPVQDKLIHPGHGAADEVIVKEGATCLTRADFWTLGLRREMESDVICLIPFALTGQRHTVYIADMYVVATWKSGKDPLAYFPENADMKDALVFPAWTQATGSDHYLFVTISFWIATK
uniref:Si:dkey-13e3.1 n=1 Tax=Sinocyclocheilus rhinocerous TaxID=307959 RepID=A0A673KCW4_9TELE